MGQRESHQCARARAICENMMTEIETRGGRRFVVEDGKWRAIDPVDGILAEAFDLVCDIEAGRCLGGGIPDIDYCYAQLIVQRYGGKITKAPKFETPVRGRIY
jgi:hypothetical protein